MRRSVLTGASAAAASTQTAVAKPLALAIARQTLPAGGGWGVVWNQGRRLDVRRRSQLRGPEPVGARPVRGVVSAGQLVGAVHGVEASQHHDFSGRP